MIDFPLFSLNKRLITLIMTKTRKITTLEFEYLESLEPYVTRKTLKPFKAFKHSLIDQAEDVFGDKWYNLGATTKHAIESICFLSVERGYVYASPDYFKEKCGVSRSAFYEARKHLINEGVIHLAHRKSKKQNGNGCQFLILTIHPYFSLIKNYLDLDTSVEVSQKAEQKAGWKAENAEIPCVASDLSDSDDSTYSLPTLDLKDHDIHTNVPETPSQHNKVIKYVPKEINALYAGIFDFRLRSVWQKITQAWKSIRHASLDRTYLLEVGSQIVKRIYQIWKEYMHNQREMSVDEMCAYAYKATRDTIYTNLATQHMFDYDAEENAIMAEAVSSIPALEDICVTANPIYDYHAIKEHVIGCIDWGYRMLSKDALARIVEHYDSYSSIRSSRSARVATG